MSGRIMSPLVELFIEGLRRYAPDALPSDAELSAMPSDESGVPLEPYRAMLAGVYERGGAPAILKSGKMLEEHADPILFVLLNSDSVALLIEKEARLSRFIHSRHVVRIVEESDSGITLEHVSSVDDPPQFTENLAAAGQHIALLEQVGCQGLSLRLPKSQDPNRYIYREGEYAEGGAEGCSLWEFTWQRFVPTRRPMPGLDSLLLAGESRPALGESTPTVASVERIVRSDLGRTWTLANVASRLDTSTRSLQRSLATESSRFSEVMDKIRVDEAKRLLRSTELSVTEIGYVCGFADTSHFSRRFKGRVGVSPTAYRSADDN